MFLTLFLFKISKTAVSEYDEKKNTRIEKLTCRQTSDYYPQPPIDSYNDSYSLWESSDFCRESLTLAVLNIGSSKPVDCRCVFITVCDITNGMKQNIEKKFLNDKGKQQKYTFLVGLPVYIESEPTELTSLLKYWLKIVSCNTYLILIFHKMVLINFNSTLEGVTKTYNSFSYTEKDVATHNKTIKVRYFKGQEIHPGHIKNILTSENFARDNFSIFYFTYKYSFEEEMELIKFISNIVDSWFCGDFRLEFIALSYDNYVLEEGFHVRDFKSVNFTEKYQTGSVFYRNEPVLITLGFLCEKDA